MNGSGHGDRSVAAIGAGFVVLLASYVWAAVAGVMPFSTVAVGPTSGIRESLLIVVRDDDEWRALWARHARVASASASVPPVDFSREMVAALFMGERATGGYTIEVTRVERTDGSLVVRYRRKPPTPGALVTQALTQPFHMIRLSRNEGPVVFVQEGPPQ